MKLMDALLLQPRIAPFYFYFSGILVSIAVEIGKEFFQYRPIPGAMSKLLLLLFSIGMLLSSFAAFSLGALLEKIKEQYFDGYASKTSAADSKIIDIYIAQHKSGLRWLFMAMVVIPFIELLFYFFGMDGVAI